MNPRLGGPRTYGGCGGSRRHWGGRKGGRGWRILHLSRIRPPRVHGVWACARAWHTMRGLPHPAVKDGHTAIRSRAAVQWAAGHNAALVCVHNGIGPSGGSGKVVAVSEALR